MEKNSEEVLREREREREVLFTALKPPFLRTQTEADPASFTPLWDARGYYRYKGSVVSLPRPPQDSVVVILSHLQVGEIRGNLSAGGKR